MRLKQGSLSPTPSPPCSHSGHLSSLSLTLLQFFSSRPLVPPFSCFSIALPFPHSMSSALLLPLTLRQPTSRSAFSLLISHSLLHPPLFSPSFSCTYIALGSQALRQNLLSSFPRPSSHGCFRRRHSSGISWQFLGTSCAPETWFPAGSLPLLPGRSPPSTWLPEPRASLFVQQHQRLPPVLFAKLSAPPRSAGPIKSHSLLRAPVRPRRQQWLRRRFAAPSQS